MGVGLVPGPLPVFFLLPDCQGEAAVTWHPQQAAERDEGWCSTSILPGMAPPTFRMGLSEIVFVDTLKCFMAILNPTRVTSPHPNPSVVLSLKKVHPS